MTRLHRFLRRLPLFTLSAGLSLAIGLIVPTVVEWGEKRAARSHHPEMEMLALFSILVSLAISLFLCVRKRSETDPCFEAEKLTTEPIQFGIRHVLIATTLIAAFFGIAPLVKIANPILFGFMGIVLTTTIGWTIFQNRIVRPKMAAVLVCAFFPFAWIIPYSKPFGGPTSGFLSAVLFAPGLIPALIIRRGNVDDSILIAILFVILEICVGIWLARRGGKLFLAYLCMVLGLSSFTSFVFHALYRM